MKTNLRALRKDRRMTQEQLAKSVGATKRQVGAWERGENELPMDYACSIANVLGVTLDDISGRRINYAVVELPAAGSVTAELTADENELVELYRQLDGRRQERVLEGIRDYVVATRSGK